MKTTILKNTVLSLLFVLTTSILANAQDGYGIGDKISDFSLKSVSGKMVSLADFEDAKGFIIIFSCNHCPWVVLYEDRMIELHNYLAPKGFPLIAINPNDSVTVPQDSYSNMVKRAAEKEFPFEYLHDETQEVAKKFGATRTPHVYIVKREGMTVEYIGTIDDSPRDANNVKENYVKNAVKELLANKAVSVKETKAIGCTIKWKKN